MPGAGEDPDGGVLPEALEAALYAACFDASAPEAALAALVAAHPEHAAALRRLAAAVRGAERELGALRGGDPDGLAPGTVLGVYTIERELGRGSFGIVYLARQDAPVRRAVAIKVLTYHGGTPEVLRRFAAERDVLAQLDHPGVTRVFDAGATPGGQPFFVMEFVAGAPLTGFADAERLPLAARLRLFVQLCDVVQHAHQHGVVHRDLKPGNVLVRRRDGVVEVKVIDFGLAKLMATDLGAADEPSSTELGRLLGTPEYMSPEQARGEAVDTRTDVHALGVMLFELLTGELPFPAERLRAQGLASVVRVLDQEEAPLPSARLVRTAAAAAALRATTPAALRAALRGDLDLVVRTCLQKERDRRYGSAAELAADVVRHLEHQPLSVRPPRLGYVLRKLLRRHRFAGLAAAVVLAALVGAAGVLAWSVVRVAAARDVAELNAYAATIGAARAALESERAAEARSLLAGAAPEHRGLEYDVLAAAIEDAGQVVPTGVYYIGGFAMLPGGPLVLDRQRPALLVRGDTADEPMRRIPVPRPPRAVAVDAAMTRFAVVQEGGFVTLWDAATLRPQRTFALPGDTGDWAVFGPDGDDLLVCSGPELWIVSLANGVVRHRCPHRDNIWSFELDPRRRRVAVGDHSGEVRLWDPREGTLLDVLRTPAVVRRLCFDPHRDVLFTAGDDATIRAWDVRLHTLLAAQTTVGALVHDLVCDPRGERLLSCHDDGTVRQWDLPGLRDRGAFRGHAGGVVRVRHVDGGWWTVATDQTLRRWPELVPPRAVPLTGLRGTPLRLALHPSRPHLLVATLGGMVGAFTLDGDRLLWGVETGRDRCHGLALVEPDRLWVTSGELLLGYDAATGARVTAATPMPGRQLRDLHALPGGRELLVATDDLTLLRCDAVTGARLAVLAPPPRGVGDPYAVVLHDEGRAATVCVPAEGASCCDLATGTWRWHLRGEFVAGAAPPGRDHVLLLRRDALLLEVDAATGVVRGERWRGTGDAATVTITGDARRILVAGSRCQVLLPDSGRELLELPGDRYGAAFVAVDPARGLLVTGGGHFYQPAELRRWPMRPSPR